MKKMIASIIAFIGFMLVAGEPTTEAAEANLLLIKIIGLVCFTGGLYFAGAFRKEFYK